MKIYVASDHAGFQLKESLKKQLISDGLDVEDCGAVDFNQDDDYPDFISQAAQKVSNDPLNCKAIVIGGSGQGEAMVANKFKNTRCCVFYGSVKPVTGADFTGRVSNDPLEIVRLSREHNDSNILSLGARFLTDEEVYRAVKVWLETPFGMDERHRRRLGKIEKIENSW